MVDDAAVIQVINPTIVAHVAPCVDK
jgi:hypothetical protein